MFYVYAPTGRVFSGSLENLRRVEKSREAAKQRQITQEEEYVRSDINASVPYQVSGMAISQYQAMLHDASQQEAVYHAYQVMAQPAVSINGEESWERAYELFEQVSYQVIPVLDNKTHLVAALSRRDLYHSLLSQHSGSIGKQTTVMGLTGGEDKSVISADPVTDVRRIATFMVEHRLDAIPIVESSHRLVGIVSRTDILKCVTSSPPLSMWC